MKHQLTRTSLTNSDTAWAALLILLLMVVAGVTAVGCGWAGTSHSVRFNSYQDEREMGRLPPLPTRPDGSNEARIYWDSEEEPGPDPDDNSVRLDPPEEKLDALWERGEAAEKDGNLKLDRALLIEYLKRTDAVRDYWNDSEDRQARRNSAIDRLDAMTAVDHGVTSSAVTAYLNARELLDARSGSEAIASALKLVPPHPDLKDNVAYLNAAILYRQSEFARSAAAFKALAQQYSHSEKREAALFMTAVATMKTSATYIPDTGNAGWDYGENEELKTDQAWHEAFAAFERLIREYPRGRYYNEARSWQAYLFLRRQDRASALAQYYRLLADPDKNARIEAAFSLTLVRWPATYEEMSRVENDLADEPQAALAYAYHNIYNFSIDPGEAYPPDNDEEIRGRDGEIDYVAQRRRDEAEAAEWQHRREDAGSRTLRRTLEFSKRLLTRYPGLSVGGGFALRVAQASEELEDNESAMKFAQQALKNQLSGDNRAQALWTLGIAQHRLHRLGEARISFEKLLRDHPDTNLTEGARRMLAIIAEDAGDIDAALEQYIALEYHIDEAYFVDILMTPEQLASFIQKHSNSPKANEFVYALGVRYLRANRWEEARKTFAQVKTSGDYGYNYYCGWCHCNAGQTTNCDDPKSDAFGSAEDENGKVQISSRLILRDVQTANDLEALERNVGLAADDEAKAEALYQYASYQYEASSLLFYNPFASPGYFNLGEFAGQDRYRVPKESQLLFESTQEHERLARALKIYLDAVNLFPRTRAARDALYTAAVCHERLANYNPYWRLIYGNGLHAGERMVSYADVQAAYPNYQLPRGTYGWQPKTRTVNDGPGWAAAPQPPPRLTKRERVRLAVHDLKERLMAAWTDYGKRWCTEILMVLGLVVTMRFARRNHRRLRTRLARQRLEQARQVVSYPWFELFLIDPETPSRRERLRKFRRAKQEEFVTLLRDRRTRPVLLRSIVSHATVTVLGISLLWTVWFS